MLASRARNVPDIASASADSLVALHSRASPWRSTATSPFSTCVRVPCGPFTEILSAASITSTPAGTTIGFLATLDMVPPLRDDAEHFAADTIGARFAVGHQALGCGNDRDTETVHHTRDVFAALVHAQAGTAHALDLFDHGTVSVIFQADFEQGLAVVSNDLEVLHITFVLQHLGDSRLDLGRRHLH